MRRHPLLGDAGVGRTRANASVRPRSPRRARARAAQLALWAASAIALAGLAPAAASAADPGDPGRWAETGRSTIPLNYYQGITADPQVNLYFDGIYSGLYRTNSTLTETARNDDVIPLTVKLTENYNHIGDITWDRAEGGRILLPLECYYPGTPNGGNSCMTGSIGVASAQTLQWSYYVKLDPTFIKKAMWSEVSPSGALLWTSSGNNLLAYDTSQITPANAAPAGPKLRPVPARTLVNVVPTGGITGATFYGDGRLYFANQTSNILRVYSIDVSPGSTIASRRLEIERTIVGESEGLAVFNSLGGVLHWQIQPYNDGAIPTYEPTNGSLLHFRPVAADVADGDGDGVFDSSDNCPTVANANQANADGDALGDVCDPDDDNDGVNDTADNCPTVANADQANADGDALGDACDPDDDNDGVLDANDACPIQAGAGADGCPVVGPNDSDNDGVPDSSDNCPAVANADQADADSDMQGDVCDPDDDNDGVADTTDNCRATPNPDQANSDADALGDACDPDDDNDGVLDAGDNCSQTANADQADNDQDGVGDVCDEDDDNDGVPDSSDNCQTTANLDQLNTDGDAQGDVCDPDDDNDGVDDTTDNCRTTPNPDQANSDADALGDACDPDDDNDGVLDANDACPIQAGAGADGCPVVGPNDSDNDGVPDSSDNCPAVANADQADADSDMQGDVCDPDDDNDGLSDALERQRGTRPFDLDSDDDGIADGTEDRNHNGKLNRGETDPARRNTDRDGLADGLERGVSRGVADPEGPIQGTNNSRFRRDRDPDTRTNPRRRDTDHDGVIDGVEDKNRNGRRDRGETNPRRADA